FLIHVFLAIGVFSSIGVVSSFCAYFFFIHFKSCLSLCSMPFPFFLLLSSCCAVLAIEYIFFSIPNRMSLDVLIKSDHDSSIYNRLVSSWKRKKRALSSRPS